MAAKVVMLRRFSQRTALLSTSCFAPASTLSGRTFSSQVSNSIATPGAPPVSMVHYDDLKNGTPLAICKLREAFMGKKAYGAIVIEGIPGYGEARRRAYRAGIDLALLDPEGRKKAAAVNNTYPGWSGTPGSETHPLQSSFLFNVKEEVSRPDGKPPNGVDPYFGKNIFPSEDFRDSFVGLANPMHEAALHVLRNCDVLMEVACGLEGKEWTRDGRSLYKLGLEGPALAGRFICYDAAFTREDQMLNEKEPDHDLEAPGDTRSMAGVGYAQQKAAGHAGDGLASMRTHQTPVKSAGHAGDGLASMRTHQTPVKSAGHAGDGLASMRTHQTPVKSAGHAGDGLASMRTHQTPVKSAGHAGDGLASMRTHQTPVKSAGHAGDGLASMRTHQTPVKSAGHAGDGLASMRTHQTPVKSAGHAGDGLASMRTHQTPVKSAGHAGDGLASMRTHQTPVKSAGHAGDGLRSRTPVKSAALPSESRRQSSTTTVSSTSSADTYVPPMMPEPEVQTQPEASEEEKKDVGDYWLPWHIDSNFVTLIHKEMYAWEKDGSFVDKKDEPAGAGVVFMNGHGEVNVLPPLEDEGVLVFQMGAFAQIYAGGHLTSGRHAVRNPESKGIARFNYCNFWYVNWDTPCIPPPGMEERAISRGWNSMMDDSYLNITMKQGFAAFRQFMTSPEARLQFQDSVLFKELSALMPLPARVAAGNDAKVVIDVLTDIRCPISYISILNLEQSLKNLGLAKDTLIRYHPLFLNVNVLKEGEALDDYLHREFGYTKEYARSETYPLRLLGLEAGVNFSPDRRVVNTIDAACIVEMAQEKGKGRDMFELMSRRYFEDAKDISDENVLVELAEEVGLDGSYVREQLKMSEHEGGVRQRVMDRYAQINEQVDQVPHFVLRERLSGNGVDVGGRRDVDSWEKALEFTLEKGRFSGMRVPGLNGTETHLVEADPNSPISMALDAQHGWVQPEWPYTEEDFSRMDETEDTNMYAEPRFVNHLDDVSIARLTNAYRSFFENAPKDVQILDMCSSWVSHFPELPSEARVVVHGINERELQANMIASDHLDQDLNANPKLPYEDNSFHFVTNALSVQYLTDPRAVFEEVHRVLKPGGVAIVAFSHRTFIEKAVNVWAKETYDGEGHVHLISRYFQHGPADGWTGVSSADVSPAHGDPMWLVTAVKK